MTDEATPAVHPRVGAIARAWNDLSPSEAEALLALSQLPPGYRATTWRNLPPDVRQRLLGSVRAAIQLGRFLEAAVL